MSLTPICCLLFFSYHDMQIGVNDISTVSLTFLTNVTPCHESISWHGMNNKQYIDVNDISTVSLTFLMPRYAFMIGSYICKKCQWYCGNVVDIYILLVIRLMPRYAFMMCSYICKKCQWYCWNVQQYIINISYKCNCISWKHILAWDEQEAVYIDVTDISTVSLTFLTNVTAYHESIFRHGMNNKLMILLKCRWHLYTACSSHA
jgi:hypothetical protein